MYQLSGCIFQTTDKKLFDEISNQYYKQLQSGQPCYLYDENDNRIGTINEISIESNGDECKLIANCEIYHKIDKIPKRVS